jgi:outer membrane protein assembly factor BamE
MVITIARATLFAVAILLATGCSRSWIPTFYRIDIRQGNYVDQETVDQLRTGMSKRQVQYLMGTPLVADPFHPDRWDYFYSFEPDGGKIEQRRISLFFEEDTLARIDNTDWQP